MDLPVDIPGFTLLAWVSASEDVVGASNLLRKRVRNEGKAQQLSCWGWYYSDEKVANREIRVWHFVIENGYRMMDKAKTPRHKLDRGMIYNRTKGL